MKQNSWKALFNQGHGIKFIAAVLGLVMLCVFTAFAVPSMAGSPEGETAAAAAGEAWGVDSAVVSEMPGTQEYQVISYENGSQGIGITSHADFAESTRSVASKASPSRPDTVSYADASLGCGEIYSHAETYSGDTFSLAGTCSGATYSGDTFSRETHSAIFRPSLECVRPSNGVSSWHNTGSRASGGFLWMSDEQIRDEIDTIVLCRFYNLPSGGQGRSFDFDMFYEILGIVKQYEWQKYNGYYDVYMLEGNEIAIIGHNEVYSYLCFARDEQGRKMVWSAFDYKKAYLSEEDYTYICDLLAHAR